VNGDGGNGRQVLSDAARDLAGADMSAPARATGRDGKSYPAALGAAVRTEPPQMGRANLVDFVETTRRRVVATGLNPERLDWYGLLQAILIDEIRRGRVL
jgi:hypothetical protein